MHHPYKFYVRDRSEFPVSTPHSLSLVRDNWNDYHFQTLFHLWYTDADGQHHELGSVKIGRAGQTPEHPHTDIPHSFTSLEIGYFSVGQDREYYEAVMRLGKDSGGQILEALRDIAQSQEDFAVAEPENVTQTSLLRTVNSRTVVDQFRRIAHGGAALTGYDLTFAYPSAGDRISPELRFRVEPNSMPPTNVHVLIGGNGTGKTTLLNSMAKSLVGGPDERKQSGAFSVLGPADGGPIFASVVTVSFSAFDRFATIQKHGPLTYSYVGLKTGDDGESVKTTAQIANDFVTSLKNCSYGMRQSRWLRAMRTLSADPLLAESGIRDLLDSDNPESHFLDEERASSLFNELSSGHKIVVLTLTRLVEFIEEKSLALLDEPETHLHPPLLSAFTRALSDLLEDRNGVAIIATHSPVVLQEVPESCVWTISRAGNTVRPRRLALESFGEGVGTLTSHVFGLEVTRTGYHQLLMRAIDRTSGSYDESLAFFGGQVGGEARAILRSIARDD
jgi:predicted ATPase